MQGNNTFDRGGWLLHGIVGHQPELAEGYTSVGSVYFCAQGFVHLGLPVSDEFWTSAAQPWTQQRIWSGSTQGVHGDHALPKQLSLE